MTFMLINIVIIITSNTICVSFSTSFTRAQTCFFLKKKLKFKFKKKNYLFYVTLVVSIMQKDLVIN